MLGSINNRVETIIEEMPLRTQFEKDEDNGNES